MLYAGLDLDGELLALAAASHSGEDFHVEGVRRSCPAPGSPRITCAARPPGDSTPRPRAG